MRDRVRSGIRWSLAIGGAAVLGGCGAETGSADSSWGPLAVVDDSGGQSGGDDALGGTGPLEIGSDCVTLENEAGQVLLLVWRSSQVEWNDGEIVFTGPGGDVRLRDGDVIGIGGSSTVESDEPGGSTPDLDWLNEPAGSCSGELWSVHSVLLD